MLKALSANISTSTGTVSSTKTAVKPAITAKQRVSDYVEHVPDIGLDNKLTENIIAEVDSLQLKGPAGKVLTQWLSPTSTSYNYGKIVNKPKPLNTFPNISKLMALVNQHKSTTGDMDACLVSLFPSHKANLKLHKDEEELIEQSSSICTVSFGTPRELEFVLDGKKTNGRKDLTADLTLPAIDKTMNVMKPGAQLIMKHRVKAAPHSTPGKRFSISFRKIARLSDPDEPSKKSASLNPPSPTDNSIPPKKNIVLVAGDSFAARLDVKLLGKGKQDVHSIAKGGRKISEVMKSLEDFAAANPLLTVKKLFISAGTNDIRHCQNGIYHLKNSMCDLMRAAYQLFPDAKVFVQSIPPIHPNGCKYTVKNVLSMNMLIYNLCSRFRLYYLDIFGSFLDRNGNRNARLFPEFDKNKNCFDIHPNKKGMGVLAKFYIYLIHSKWFNPLGY